MRRLAEGRGILGQLLRIDAIRFAVALIRYGYLRRRRGIKTLDLPDASAPATISHNLKGLTAMAVRRSTMLIAPVSAIEAVDRDARVLSIGPRTEGEILNLVAHGFRLKNIRGLDLISYSPWIDLGDMHAMDYPDDSWDVIILGWVLAYSLDPEAAAKEVIRVARPGAICAVGVAHDPMTNEEIVEECGYLAGAPERITSVDRILSFFLPHVGTVYFRHDVPEGEKDKIGGICVVFSIEKNDTEG